VNGVARAIKRAIYLMCHGQGIIRSVIYGRRIYQGQDLTFRSDCNGMLNGFHHYLFGAGLAFRVYEDLYLPDHVSEFDSFDDTI
jgi:hypothetical protein